MLTLAEWCSFVVFAIAYVFGWLERRAARDGGGDMRGSLLGLWAVTMVASVTGVIFWLLVAAQTLLGLNVGLPL